MVSFISARFDRGNMFLSSAAAGELPALFDRLKDIYPPRYNQERITLIEVPEQENQYNGFSVLKIADYNWGADLRIQFKDKAMQEDMTLKRLIFAHAEVDGGDYSLSSSAYPVEVLSHIRSIAPDIAHNMQNKYFQAVREDTDVQEIARSLLPKLLDLKKWVEDNHQEVTRTTGLGTHLREFHYTYIYKCEDSFILWNTGSQLIFALSEDNGVMTLYGQESEYGFDQEKKLTPGYERDTVIEDEGYTFAFLKHIKKPENVVGVVENGELVLQDLKCFSLDIYVGAVHDTLVEEKAIASRPDDKEVEIGTDDIRIELRSEEDESRKNKP